MLVARPASAQVSATDQEAAKAHFLAGSSYYESANYADAVKEFNEAYRLSKRADLLYNIALGYERLSDFDNAIATLRRYLTEKADAPDRNTIEARIKNLEKLRDLHNAPPKPVEVTPPPKPVEPVKPVEQPTQKHHLGVLGYTGAGLTGVGGVLLISAIGTGIVAKQKSDHLLDACPTRTDCDPALKSYQTSGKHLALATDVMLGVGALAVVTGVALIIVDALRKPKPATVEPVAPTPTPDPNLPPPSAAPPVVGSNAFFTGTGVAVTF